MNDLLQLLGALALTAFVLTALGVGIYLISSATVNRDRCRPCSEGRFDECPEARELMGMDD